ncbi:MAG: N-acetylmuramoyl-L-alanine amidase [Gaiellales bacterium]|jgi:N-acetylmuramoyl-L-alanine amidase|nr:N-acetylmuramoyl-L-alanine amidase [Gaiellales bacterium]
MAGLRRKAGAAVAVMAVAGVLAAGPADARMDGQATTAAAVKVVTIVIDPGHNRYANLEREPIGPGSSITKIKDGGGTSGVVTGQSEAGLNMRIAKRLRTLLRATPGIRVVMTRKRTCCVSKGNIARARIANRADAVLFLRIHADGSTDHSVRGTSTLYPATHRGWTDDIDGRSYRAAQIVQRRVVRALRFPNRGLVARGDLTGFNWSNVPAILVEVGFLSNPTEDRQLATFVKMNKAAWGLRNGFMDYLRDRGLR